MSKKQTSIIFVFVLGLSTSSVFGGFVSGPVDALHDFPMFYQDANGLVGGA